MRFAQPTADFAAWATARGGYRAKVSDPKKVRPALVEALAFVPADCYQHRPASNPGY